MDDVEKILLVLLNGFYVKLWEDGHDLDYLKKVQLFADEKLLRSRRYGIYGWVDVKGIKEIYAIGSSIDWLVKPENIVSGHDQVSKNLKTYLQRAYDMFDNYDKYPLPLSEEFQNEVFELLNDEKT